MKRLLILPIILVLALAASACDSGTDPSDDSLARFTAVMLPGNEIPPVTGPDGTASGTAIVTLHLTRNGSGAITAATADFQVTLTGFTQSTITNAHVHTGAATGSGGVLFGGLSSGEWVLTNGAGSFTKNGLTDVTADEAQAVINNPAGFYFNVHSSLNGGGAIRGQLVAQP